MNEATLACHIGDADGCAYQEERGEAGFSRRFRTALPIVIANSDLKDLGAGQGLPPA